jgi:alpha-glucosidase
VFYEIFPDRFARDESQPLSLPAWAVPADWDAPVIADKTVQSRQVYGGNLAGIERRLDYLAALGVNALYLTPFFPAGSAHRYDAASFDHVDPVLGGDSALVQLVATMHARGMRIIGDLTTNHTGDLHDWHQAARADAGAAEAGFYYWQSHPDEYSSWLGVRSLPKLNHGSAELSRRMIEGPESVVGRWLRPPYSLDGWRIDVANMTGRHADDDFTTRVARGIRSTIAQVNPEALLIAEHAHDASDDLAGDGWHGTMNYAGLLRPVWAWLGEQPARRNFLGVPARVPSWSGHEAVRTMRLFHSSVPWAVASHNFNLIGSHDTARIRTVTGDPHRVEAAAGLLFTMVGLPMVFAGDELGLEGEDPEDARRPMPWHRQESWHTPTLNAYRSLGALRRSSTALRTGGLRWAHVGEDSVGFVRESAQEKLFVMVSRSAHAPVSLDAVGLGLDGEAENIYGGSPLNAADGEARFAADRPGVQVWRLH